MSSTRHGNILGIVPSRTVAYFAAHPRGFSDPCPCGAGDLINHGGPVMHTNQTYAIFWQPTTWPSSDKFPAGYQTAITQYLSDVAHDSGLRSNVYATDTQYYDSTTSTHISYNSTFVTGYNDTNAFPTSGCDDTTLYWYDPECLTDSQIQAEILRVVNAMGWPKTTTAEYFLFTPYNVGSAFDDGSGWAYYNYCAYHSHFNPSSGGTIIYANQPWTYGVSTDGWGDLNCESQAEYPNGESTGADPTISVVSHEHNESITDELGNAWYGSDGQENGDKCAWSYGSISADGTGYGYNQVINGHHYLTQMEYNNAGSGSTKCVQSLPALAPTVSTFSPTSGNPGASVTINGTGFTSVSSVKFHGVNASFTVNSGAKITATVPTSATTGTISVTTGYGTATSSGSFTVTGVTPAPTISSFSPTSGPVGTSVTINGTNLTGTSSVKFHGTSATTFHVVSAAQVTATVPSGATTGTISVTTPGGTGTSAGNYTVTTSTPPPTISSFTPTSGKTRTLVTINGTNLAGATAVKMGPTLGSSLPMPIMTKTATQITAYIWDYNTYFPTGKIYVTTPGGTVASAGSFTITFGISSVTPQSGPTGTHVTINGVGFSPTATVKFNGVAASVFSRTGSTSIVAVAPSSTASTGKITVTNTTGVVGTVYSWWTYTHS